MAIRKDDKERVRSEAAVWVARLDGSETAADREAFARWLEANPDHQAAYDRVHARYRQSALLRQSPVSRSFSLESEFPRRQRPLARAALAAGIACLLLIGGYQLSQGIFAPPLQAVMLSSGEAAEEVRLEDGTAVRLEPASVVRIELTRSERRAELRRGRARLIVAAEGRPFLLQAGTSRAEVREGQYQLSLNEGVGSIHRVEGSSAVDAEESRLTGPKTVADKQAGEVLDFNSASLAEVAARSNRSSSSPRLEIDSRIGARKVTGLFRAGDNMALARSLAAALDLDLVTAEAGTVRLEPREK